MKRTRLSVCRRKAHFVSEADALVVANAGRVPLRIYCCDRCGLFHLTSRTKGKRVSELNDSVRPAKGAAWVDHKLCSNPDTQAVDPVAR